LINNNPNLASDYSLTDQIKRASVSVITNISEGYCRTGKHCKSYFDISSGSSNEIVALLQVINAVYLINTEILQNEYKILGKQINSYTSKIK
jgi:four helix bundle protein